MPTLRLTQDPLGDDRYHIRLELSGDGLPTQSATATVTCMLSPQDHENLRWYLEDFLQYPFAPHPELAARVERRMEAVGTELFTQLFEAERGTRRIWAKVCDALPDTRLEISTGVQEAASIPWELLRDPQTHTPLALEARSFVRVQSETARAVRMPQLADGEVIRILLVLCRPGGGDDVPFRSVARRLLEGLSQEQRAHFRLDLLRPPTFARLGEVLRQAREAGQPYHVVHFDGHGTYAAACGGGFAPNRAIFHDSRAGQHGYLVFENPAVTQNMEFVSGPDLGALLAETDVPVLVLNACRSAHAEKAGSPPAPGAEAGVHTQVRAFGSLAQEVVDAGAAGVVAMRYNVYVVTAAQFVADLYGALVSGLSVGAAVTYARKQLATQPLREVVAGPLPLQDWTVPVVYEATPIRLFPRQEAAPLHVALGEALRAPGTGLDPTLPPAPDAGFYGRDETLLALDRAFDTENVVLLHAYAGSGKTATAAEFARWYAQTGGLAFGGGQGPVLFTSFEQYLPLARALDKFGAIFDATLQANNIHWLALPDEQRREVALLLLRQIPVLWIWDNVEPVTGFPTGSETPWSETEQRELADFLRAARGTRGKFLLTSRRDEAAWLTGLPRQVQLPPMPPQERRQLARALARKAGKEINLAALEPLLVYTRGNPLTLTVTVGEALREGLATRAQVAAYVERLRAGEDAFPDATGQGRSRSLGASLAYGFERAFTEDERRVLSLLHLFQGFVEVNALQYMGDPGFAAFVNSRPGVTEHFESLPELSNFQPATFNSLLNRAAEIGLLTSHGGGYYTIHPALPWFFRRLFARSFSPASPQSSSPKPDSLTPARLTDYPTARLRALRAYVEALGQLGDYYHGQYIDGNRDVIAALRAEEANLLHAWRLARAHGWFWRITSTMQGLQVLYDHTGRRAEWQALVEAVSPDLVDTATGGPLPGREEQWGLIIQHRMRLAQEARDWAGAERLQRAQVEWNRQRAAPLLAPASGEGESPAALDGAQRNTVRTLATSLGQLGDILREQGKPECVEAYQEDYDLSLRIGDEPGAAVTVFNLGHAYMQLPTLRDLDAAERWYRRSLELFDEGDRRGRAMSVGQLGLVAYERFKEAKERVSEKAGEREGEKASEREGEEQELLGHLNDALGYYQQALGLLPPDAVNDLAGVHNALGLIYKDTGDVGQAVYHWNESVRYLEAAGDFYHAGLAIRNLAAMLTQQERFAEGLAYARAALRDFQHYQGRAADKEEQTRRLIGMIEQQMGEGESKV